MQHFEVLEALAKVTEWTIAAWHMCTLCTTDAQHQPALTSLGWTDSEVKVHQIKHCKGKGQNNFLLDDLLEKV